MSAKKFTAITLITTFFIYVLIFITYLINPSIFHFRAWEMFDIFIFNGFKGRHHQMDESGDSSRSFLVQRYITKGNTISINEFGNRNACFTELARNKAAVLLLGDSQLWGSGTDDDGTFPAHLCKIFDANIYNGSRRHGIDLLRIKNYHFTSVLFTIAERNTLSAYCSKLPSLEKVFNENLNAENLIIKSSINSTLNMLNGSITFLGGYLNNRVNALFSPRHYIAPEQHLIIYPYQKTQSIVAEEARCAEQLKKFFNSRKIEVGFLYFPEHRIIHAQDISVEIDKDTQNFIDDIEKEFKKKGIRTLNSKQCLLSAKTKAPVYHTHDTHINANGYKALADCVALSDLRSLFITK